MKIIRSINCKTASTCSHALALTDMLQCINISQYILNAGIKYHFNLCFKFEILLTDKKILFANHLESLSAARIFLLTTLKV